MATIPPHREPGARWLRCDLHVHTPFDGEKKFGEDIRGAIEALKKARPQLLAAIAERFVTASRNAADGAGMDLVALTDHNSIDGYRYLRAQFEVVLPAHADGRQGISREVVEGAAVGEITVATSLWDEMKGHLRQRVITRRDWHGFQASRPFAELSQAFRELLWRWGAARRSEGLGQPNPQAWWGGHPDGHSPSSEDLRSRAVSR